MFFTIKKLIITTIILSIIFFFISGCGVVTKSTDSNSLNPPVWILGEWKDSYSMNNYDFQEHNVIFSSNTLSIDFKTVYQDGVVSETGDDSKYIITVVHNNNNGEYKFIKNNSNELSYYVSVDGLTTGPVILYKISGNFLIDGRCRLSGSSLHSDINVSIIDTNNIVRFNGGTNSEGFINTTITGLPPFTATCSKDGYGTVSVNLTTDNNYSFNIYLDSTGPSDPPI